MRFKSNAFAFYLKRTCVLTKMYLRLSPNALAFFYAIFQGMKTRDKTLFFFQFSGSKRFRILGWQHSELFFKALGEITGRTESYTVGYFRYIQFSFLKQLGRPFQTDGTNKIGWRLPGNSLQFPIKIHTTHPHIGTKLLHIVFRIVDMVFYQLQSFLNQLFVNGSNRDATWIYM